MSGETEKQVSGWTVDTLKEYVERQFAAQQQAVKDALIAQKEAVAAALAASEKAVSIAESNAEKWRMNANEWRGAMNDRERALMPRIETESAFKSINDKVESLQARMDRNEGRGATMLPVFDQLVKDTAATRAVQNENVGAIGGRLSQQQFLVTAIGLSISAIIAFITIAGIIVAIAYAVRK